MKKLAILLTLPFILLTGCLNEEINETEAKKEGQEINLQNPSNETEKEMEQQYLSFLSNSYTVYTTNINDIKQLFLKAQENPSLVTDPKWNDELDKKYQAIEEAYNKLVILPYIPSNLQSVHDMTKDAFGLTLASKAKIIEGIKKMDEKLINEGASMIKESGKKFDQVNMLMKKE